MIRIAVPDLRVILSDYEKGSFPAVDLLERLGVSSEMPGDGRLLAPHVRFPHRCTYDAHSLIEALRGAGLDARLQPPQISRIADVDAVESEERTRDSLIAEAQRGGA